MNTSQIIEELKKTQQNIRELYSQIGKEEQKKNLLTIARKNNLLKHFSDYIELNTQYEFKDFASFNGSKLGLKKGETSSPSFAPGDIIIWSKKNPKSIVVKCIKKWEKVG